MKTAHLLVVLVLALIGFSMGGSAEAQQVISADTIGRAYDSNELRAALTYEGKTLVIRGRVRSVDAASGGSQRFYVVLDAEGTFLGIWVRTNREWVLDINEGQTITVRCDDFKDSFGLECDNGTLVSSY